MQDIICVNCDDSFPINNETAKRMLFQESPYLRHLHAICPYCDQHYKLFTDVDADKLLSKMGIGLRLTTRPPPSELEEMYNKQFFPGVDEEVVAKFMDQVEAYSRS